MGELYQGNPNPQKIGSNRKLRTLIENQNEFRSNRRNMEH